MVVYIRFFAILAQVSILPKCGWRVHKLVLPFRSFPARISSYSASKYSKDLMQIKSNVMVKVDLVNRRLLMLYTHSRDHLQHSLELCSQNMCVCGYMYVCMSCILENYLYHKRFWVGFFIISIISWNNFFYNNVILLVLFKKKIIFIIFTILLLSLKKNKHGLLGLLQFEFHKYI